VDFQAWSSAPGAAAETSKSAVKEKGDAKIEGAVQVAIGVKKEVDFAAWYTNVSPTIDVVMRCRVITCPVGLD
jgi:prolyl-tRNA synthetase